MLASLAAHGRVTDGGKSLARTKHKNLAADKVGTALVIRTSSNRSPRLGRPPARPTVNRSLSLDDNVLETPAAVERSQDLTMPFGNVP